MLQDWILRSNRIPAIDASWKEKARRRLCDQTRPEGSLGLLEAYLERLVAIQKRDRPDISRKRILIFAGDHGVVEEGVSLYPREVTRAMVLNFLNGGATVNALARQIGADVKVVDMGVVADFDREERLIHAKVRHGTRNMTREPAMTEEETHQAMQVGWNLVHEAKKEGVHLLGLGEMGIANTTAASAVIAALTGGAVESVTGRGTGLDDSRLQHKIEIIEKALKLHFPPHLNPLPPGGRGKGEGVDPLTVLRCVGGYELAALTGAIVAGARLALPVVVDGWIVSASALVACRLNIRILDYLFFAHESEERGHGLLLEELDVRPLLRLGMRLGEASGAALAMGILDAAVHIYNEVATFSEAGIAGKISFTLQERS